MRGKFDLVAETIIVPFEEWAASRPPFEPDPVPIIHDMAMRLHPNLRAAFLARLTPPSPPVATSKQPGRVHVKDAQWVAIIGACRLLWPDLSPNAAADKMWEAAERYRDGEFSRNQQMNRVPASEPSRTIHAVLVENKDQRNPFPSARTIRRKIDLS